ncbi:hypothetical protein [Sphingomonas sp.]|jgi:hypothetical protein|uniref:hypothetical protein n=1 Tax=Sphingomonas sp. TaxID=28214 RepID=UPI002E377B11|nr:hypothetical protein [Sphingomonas sp.]HEX4694639.1 hypothetical protein [Sphingomonas sp.]
MDPDDAIVAAIGVLLTQLRSARRALEDVQRSTSRYGGFEFAKAFASGERFGAPPMFDGALMVHVVNINDLAPGNSFGGFIEALLGGVGNFFGNLIGGVVGGTLSAWKLPDMIERLDRIVQNIGGIVDRLGIGGKKPDAKTGDPQSAPEAQAKTGESLLATLEGIRGTLKDVTALFTVTTKGPGDAARVSQTPLSETGERWMAILNGVNILLDRAGRLVDGLVLLIPMAVGGIAFLIANLGEIRRALLETIQFLLRNALVLRGVLLTVVFETVASAARLAANVVGIIGDTIQSVLTAIFQVIKKLLVAAFDALETLATALQAVVQSLLTWLVDGLFNVLRAIGDLTVFRTIDHLIKVLPSLLSAIYVLKSSTSLPGDIQGMLNAAQTAVLKDSSAAPAGTAGGVTNQGLAVAPTIIGAFPDLKGMLKPLGDTLASGIDATGADVVADVKVSIGNITTALGGVSGRFDQAARDEAKFSSGVLRAYGADIAKNSDDLTKTITAPAQASGAPTGFELIAKSYEQWLTGGGMKSVLDEASKHFTEAPKDGGAPTGALRLLRGQFDRPRASIEIDEVEIVIQPGEDPARHEKTAPSEYGPGDFPTRPHTDEDVWLAVRRHERELEDRGIRPAELDAMLI